VPIPGPDTATAREIAAKFAAQPGAAHGTQVPSESVADARESGSTD
jgi:hypothetical protein